jgi:hypothetical protein
VKISTVKATHNYWEKFGIRGLHTLLLGIVLSFVKTHTEGHTFLASVNKVTLTVRPYDILEVQDALGESVYFITEYTMCITLEVINNSDPTK